VRFKTHCVVPHPASETIRHPSHEAGSSVSFSTARGMSKWLCKPYSVHSACSVGQPFRFSVQNQISAVQNQRISAAENAPKKQPLKFFCQNSVLRPAKRSPKTGSFVIDSLR
jgi:hypothetical protein